MSVSLYYMLIIAQMYSNFHPSLRTMSDQPYHSALQARFSKPRSNARASNYDDHGMPSIFSVEVGFGSIFHNEAAATKYLIDKGVLAGRETGTKAWGKKVLKIRGACPKVTSIDNSIDNVSNGSSPTTAIKCNGDLWFKKEWDLSISLIHETTTTLLDLYRTLHIQSLHQDCYKLRCSKCDAHYSIRNNSFFTRTKLQSHTLLLLIYFWLQKIPVGKASSMCGIERNTASQ